MVFNDGKIKTEIKLLITTLLTPLSHNIRKKLIRISTDTLSSSVTILILKCIFGKEEMEGNCPMTQIISTC